MEGKQNKTQHSSFSLAFEQKPYLKKKKIEGKNSPYISANLI